MNQVTFIKRSVCFSVMIIMIFVLSGCSQTCEVCAGTGTVACDNCSDGTITCPECEGKGLFDCEKCDGTGNIKTDEECPKCKDSRRKGYDFDTVQALKDYLSGVERNQEEYWSKCFQCDGSGYVLEECSDCKGTGHGSDCKSCNATGIIACPKCSGTKEVVCTVCEGAGKVKK